MVIAGCSCQQGKAQERRTFYLCPPVDARNPKEYDGSDVLIVYERAATLKDYFNLPNNKLRRVEGTKLGQARWNRFTESTVVKVGYI